MLNDIKKQSLIELLQSFSLDELIWTSGYIDGLLQNVSSKASSVVRSLTIAYGTETGNTKNIAGKIEKLARSYGIKVKNMALSKIKCADISLLDHPIIFLSSTHGEGEPPATAKNFFKDMDNQTVFACPKLQFAVLGLGDRAYTQFCKAAQDIRDFLSQAGGQEFYPFTALDVDYEAHSDEWIKNIFSAYHTLFPEQDSVSLSVVKPIQKMSSSVGYSRLSPIKASVTENILLNDTGSLKETYHIALKFSQNIAYEVGDAVGIILPPLEDGTVPAPRLYSIASSPLMTPEGADLTISHAWHDLPDGKRGFGLASHYVTQLPKNAPLEIYIHRNHQFRLPEDDKDIIMIGAGTGIAPFRAFLQERQERGATGRNWLFFGEQYAHYDFLYQTELQDWVANGTLSHIHLAFSRDQKEKIYVQYRLLENSSHIASWLKDGASLYLCGRKDPMSFDVEKALIQIIMQEYDVLQEDAQNYLLDLADEGRYLKDVY